VKQMEIVEAVKGIDDVKGTYDVDVFFPKRRG
jgi:hypothetical protein